MRAFKDQCSQERMKLFLTLPAETPALEFERSLTCLYNKNKKIGTEEIKERASTTQVGGCSEVLIYHYGSD